MAKIGEFFKKTGEVIHDVAHGAWGFVKGSFTGGLTGLTIGSVIGLVASSYRKNPTGSIAGVTRADTIMHYTGKAALWTASIIGVIGGMGKIYQHGKSHGRKLGPEPEAMPQQVEESEKQALATHREAHQTAVKAEQPAAAPESVGYAPAMQTYETQAPAVPQESATRAEPLAEEEKTRFSDKFKKEVEAQPASAIRAQLESMARQIARDDPEFFQKVVAEKQAMEQKAPAGVSH